MKSLSDHYKLYSAHDCYNADKLTIEDLTKYDWFKLEHMEDYERNHPLEYWKYHCFVELDDGSFRTLNVGTWIGYFETLRGAKITCVGNDKDNITF